MAKTFHLDIIASDKYFFSGECERLIFPGIDGSYGVLAGHEPMISCLSSGELRYMCDGEWHSAAVSDGFLEIMPDFVKILADTVERPEDIDRKRAEAAKERAEERLRQKLSIKQYYHTQAALNRAMARLKLSDKNSSIMFKR